MDSILYDAENLVVFLGCSRTDSNFERFENECLSISNCNVSRDDGVDAEHVEFRDLGFCFYFETSILNSVFLFSDKKDPDYVTYSFGLPKGLSFELSRSQVLELLGVPDSHGGGDEDSFFGYIPFWAKYKYEGYCIHIEFSTNDESIQLITLTQLSLE